jgi:hypothetical protein
VRKGEFDEKLQEIEAIVNKKVKLLKFNIFERLKS